MVVAFWVTRGMEDRHHRRGDTKACMAGTNRRRHWVFRAAQALRVAWTHSVERNLAGCWISKSLKFNQTRCHILGDFESNLLDMKWESCGMWWCGKMDQISMISGLLFAWIVEDTTLSPGFWRRQRKSMCFFFQRVTRSKASWRCWNIESLESLSILTFSSNDWYVSYMRNWSELMVLKTSSTLKFGLENKNRPAVIMESAWHVYCPLINTAMQCVFAYGDLLIQLRCLQ